MNREEPSRDRAAEEGNAAGGSEGDGTPLEVLRWNWGEVYEIGCDDGEWWCRRRDGLGGRETAQNADALHKLIIEDYMFLPVRRETP